MLSLIEGGNAPQAILIQSFDEFLESETCEVSGVHAVRGTAPLCLAAGIIAGCRDGWRAFSAGERPTPKLTR
jgi:hypothetical protein